MKRYFISIIVLFVFIPFHVFAEDNGTCEPINTHDEKTIDVKVTHIVKNKENIRDEDLSKFKFHYKILDLDDTVLAETTNDDDGNVIFHCFDVKSSDIGQYKLYKIVMEENEDSPFTSDPYIIYFSLRPKYTNEFFDPIIAFYKDDGDDSPERYNTTYKGKVFHATEEDLQGEAYAVFDSNTRILTVFRDEEGKYNNGQVIDNKTYYTNIETVNMFWVEKFVSFIVEDPIKPKYMKDWFLYQQDLENVDISKVDTSLITDLSNFAKIGTSNKLSSLDISTMDVSNVNRYSYAFQGTNIEYLDFTVWNIKRTSDRNVIDNLANGMKKLKYLNISNLYAQSDSAEFGNLTCLEKLVINNEYNFYRTNIVGDSADFWYNPKKNSSYTSDQIRDNLYNHSEMMAGYYIRPMCTNEASFVSTYNPSEEPSIEIPVPDTAMNKTTGLIIGGFLVVIIGFMVVSYVAKSKENID